VASASGGHLRSGRRQEGLCNLLKHRQGFAAGGVAGEGGIEIEIHLAGMRLAREPKRASSRYVGMTDAGTEPVLGQGSRRRLLEGRQHSADLRPASVDPGL
jgi:hypothetical protein